MKRRPSESLRFEYDQLRKEILHTDSLLNQRAQFILAVTGALIAAAASKLDNPYFVGGLAFVAYLLCFSSGLQEVERIRGVFSVAAYIRTFLDGEDVALWETRLHAARLKNAWLEGVVSRNIQIYGVVSALSMAMVCHSIARILRLGGDWVPAVSFGVGLALGSAISLWLISQYRSVLLTQGKASLDIWKQIAEEEAHDATGELVERSLGEGQDDVEPHHEAVGAEASERAQGRVG
jgi:hypothetical protein